MTRFKQGTPVVGAEYGSYTVEQLKAVEEAKERSYTLGVARAEFVNKALLPDGSLINADEIGTSVSEDLANLMKEPPTAETLQSALALARLSEEVIDHIGQERFLFVVNDDLTRIIYFQCDVPHNPDLPALIETDEHREAQQQQIANVARVLDESHQAAQIAAAKAKAQEN
jgi:hypothetical protein